MAATLHRLGAWCAAHPWPTLLVWVGVLSAVTVLAGLAGGVLRDTTTVPRSSSDAATQRLAH